MCEELKYSAFGTSRSLWGRLSTRPRTHPAELWIERTRKNLDRIRLGHERKRAKSRLGFLWGRNPAGR